MVRRAASKKKTTKSKVRVKKSTEKRKTTKVTYRSTKEITIEKALIENFVGLQKVMVNLSSKFDNLANQIAKLLELFEISAKALARKDFGIEKGEKDSEKIIEKIDNLSKQAGLIGKGLVLIHESGKGLSPNTGEIQEHGEIIPQPQMRKPPIPGIPQRSAQGMEGYQRSINPRVQRKERSTEEENDQTNF